jgi:hypothetical protein
MPLLVDVQATITQAMLTGDCGLAPPSLVGGYDPRARLGIHLRHYHASLQATLHDKFPATAWLLGSKLFNAAAAAYVREHPPQAPCIAEYGSGFPGFIALFEQAQSLPYLESFATLEWALGRASIAVNESPIKWNDLVAAGPALLLDAHLVLQPGLCYLRATHGIDVLMRLYLNDQEPETFAMSAEDAFIEVQGSRGTLRMTRLDTGTFAFRDALRDGDSVSDAAGRALETDEHFNAGRALRELVDAGLALATHVREEGMR